MTAVLFSVLVLAQSHEGDLFARMRARQQEVSRLAAVIEQVKSYPQLGIDDPAERGRLYLERSRRGETKVRLEITAPETRILISSNGGYLLYQPRIKQAVEGALSGGGKKALFSGLLTGSSEAARQLERDYTVEEIDGTHLRFQAKAGAEVHCEQIDLWLDVRSGLPARQSCREANQSVITISLTEIEVDGKLPEGVFEIDLPPDVERVKG